MTSPTPGRAGGERGMALRALVSVVFAAYVGTVVAGERASAAAAAVSYLLVVVVFVVLHELAHAAAVLAIGGKLVGIRLGFGPRLIDARVRGVELDIRPLLIAGHVSWQAPDSARRPQLAAVLGAGLVVHALGALVALALAAGGGPWPVWRSDLLVANLLALLSNALPQIGNLTSTGNGPNDGQQLAALLFRRRARRAPVAGPGRADGPPPAWAPPPGVGVGGAAPPAAVALRTASADLARLLATVPGPADPAAVQAARWSSHAALEAADRLEGPAAEGLRRNAAITAALVDVVTGADVDGGRRALRRLARRTISPAEDVTVEAGTGWAALLLGDRRRAEASLRSVLDDVATNPVAAAFSRLFAATPHR